MPRGKPPPVGGRDRVCGGSSVLPGPVNVSIVDGSPKQGGGSAAVSSTATVADQPLTGTGVTVTPVLTGSSTTLTVGFTDANTFDNSGAYSFIDTVGSRPHPAFLPIAFLGVAAVGQDAVRFGVAFHPARFFIPRRMDCPGGSLGLLLFYHKSHHDEARQRAEQPACLVYFP